LLKTAVTIEIDAGVKHFTIAKTDLDDIRNVADYLRSKAMHMTNAISVVVIDSNYIGHKLGYEKDNASEPTTNILYFLKAVGFYVIPVFSNKFVIQEKTKTM